METEAKQEAMPEERLAEIEKLLNEWVRFSFARSTVHRLVHEIRRLQLALTEEQENPGKCEDCEERRGEPEWGDRD